MALTTEEVQESVLALLRDNMAQRVEEIAIPEAETLIRNKHGKIDPYLAIQFGDMQTRYMSGRSFIGPRYENHELPVYVQVVSPNPEIGRKLKNRVDDLLLGSEHPYSSLMRKRLGGGMWPVIGSNRATEAYIYPSSYGVNFQPDTEYN